MGLYSTFWTLVRTSARLCCYMHRDRDGDCLVLQTLGQPGTFEPTSPRCWLCPIPRTAAAVPGMLRVLLACRYATPSRGPPSSSCSVSGTLPCRAGAIGPLRAVLLPQGGPLRWESRRPGPRPQTAATWAGQLSMHPSNLVHCFVKSQCCPIGLRIAAPYLDPLALHESTKIPVRIRSSQPCAKYLVSS